MKHTLLIKDWLSSFLSLLFPRCCVVCDRPLAKGEECICTVCNINLPRTNYHLRKDNPVERLFWGQIPLERATSFFFYEKGSDFRLILHRLKYGGQKEIGAIMGRYMAAELLSSHFFQGIDVIIPIPLHKKKQQIRGYNQSEWIARGITAVTGIPIDTESILRKKNTETQTRKSVFERRDNVEGIFELQHPETLAGKHILIVDDVLTTGSTTLACASCLVDVEDIRISILTLAMARRILRDMGNATGDEIRQSMELYLKYARIAYIQMIKDVLPSSDYIIDGTKELSEKTDEIIKIMLSL